MISSLLAALAAAATASASSGVEDESLGGESAVSAPAATWDDGGKGAPSEWGGIADGAEGW